MRVLVALLLLVAAPAGGETVVAARTLRSHAVIRAQDIRIMEGEPEGAFSRISDVVGLEARIALYQGRPIHPGDVGPPALIDRNQTVTLVYSRSGLMIRTGGRALGRAAVGEALKVMNLASRNTVWGTVAADGSVVVGVASGPKPGRE